MKKAFLVISIVLAMSFGSCSKMALEVVEEDIPQQPDTIPTKPDTIPTNNTWRWSAIMDQTVTFDQTTEVVTANNIAQLTKQSGETKLDSAQLRYQFLVELSAPTHVVVMSQDTTKYTGKGLQKSSYDDWYRQGTDSLHKVTTFVEGGFKTNYYTISLTTNRLEGYSLHAGKWVPYKNVTETSAMTSVWHEAMNEIERNDSIFDREVVHHVITITLTGNRGQKWQITREKVVVVDHFLRLKEQEQPEPEHNHPAWWGEPLAIIGQGTFVYRPAVGPEGQGQFYKNINVLFENVLVCMVTKTFVNGNYSPMDFNYTDADVYPIGSTLRGVTITEENVTDLNSAIWRDGKWEPAMCSYDQKNFSWIYVSFDKFHQDMSEHLAETCGLKNFAGKHTARLHPSLFYKETLDNGTLTIKDDNGVAFKSFH